MRDRWQRPPWLGSPVPAVEFLTTLRWHLAPVRPAEEVGRALWAFALVGALLGLALFGLERGLREIAPEPALAVLLVIAWIALTGGLHVDGLADAADGLFGGRDREDRLQIMRDTQTGTWGAVAVVLVLLAKFGFLLSLPVDGRFAALLFAPAAARGLVVVAMGSVPYARAAGYGRGLHALARGGPAAASVLLVAGAAVVAFGPEGLLVLVAVGGAVAAGTLYARARLGGLTGDVDGALIEIGELAALLGAAVALDQGWIESFVWSGS